MRLSTLLLAASGIISTTRAIPAAIYEAGKYALHAQGTPIVILDNGVQVSFQVGDSNLVVYKDGKAVWNSQVSLPGACNNQECVINFQPDGNLVTYYEQTPTFFTSTGGNQGKWLVFFSVEPYIVIYNAALQPIWHTPITPPAAMPQVSNRGSQPCAAVTAEGLCDNFPPPNDYLQYNIDF